VGVRARTKKYVKNIFEGGDGDFIKAEETIYYYLRHPTHIGLPVMK
jgi:hypothetical protein